jgi:hypothetical protein
VAVGVTVEVMVTEVPTIWGDAGAALVTVVLAVVPTAEAGDTPMNDKPVNKRAEHAPTDTTLAIAERTDGRPPSRLIIFITDLPLSLG